MNKHNIFDILSLNDKQKEAVLENDHHLLLLSGAGSGKTRTIISKILYDLIVLKIPEESILAVTFTNKAAEEMRDRLSSYLCTGEGENVVIKTFHSFGALFLRQFYYKKDLSPYFAIYDENDALSLLQTSFSDMTLKELKPFMENIFSAKERGYSSKNYKDFFDYHIDTEKYFIEYEKLLRESKNVDLPDLINLSTEILCENPDIRKYFQAKFKKIYVDEYQDTNSAQFSLLKCLVGDENILCVVGDDDQSIYGFRGSEVEHILNFNKFFKNSKIIKLEQNYRSSSNIISLAASVIKNNRDRHDKTLWTENKSGTLPVVCSLDDEKKEAQYVANIIEKSSDGYSNAVLYRTNSQSLAFENLFLERKIKYHVLRGNSFYKRADIKDVVALIAFTINPSDKVAFTRIINKPARGIGDQSITKILSLADEKYSSNILTALENITLSKKADEGIKIFVAAIKSSLTDLENNDNRAFLLNLLNLSGLYDYYKTLDEKEGNEEDSHVKALEALSSQMNSFEGGIKGVVALLERMALVNLQDTESDEGVALSTIHGVKGLEFDRVFITGLEEGIFPSKRAEESADKEEERRLLYVAITRAKKELYITHCTSRYKWGHTEINLPSSFLKELDNKYCTFENRSFISQPYFKSFNNYKNKEVKLSRFEKEQFYKNKNILLKKKNINDLPFSSSFILDKNEELPFSNKDRVICDDEGYGEGVVSNIRKIQNRYIMDVIFKSGRVHSYPINTKKVRKL